MWGQLNNRPSSHHHLLLLTPPPSVHQPPLHVPIIAFASCFQVRTERGDWPRLGCGLFLLRSARLRLQSSSSCCTHRSAESFTDSTLKNTPAWRCWRADSEPPSGLVSRSNLPSALFQSPSGDKQAGDAQHIYAQAARQAPSWTRDCPEAQRARGAARRGAQSPGGYLQ